MPYSEAWNSAAPLGSTAANQIDNVLRAVRLQVQERMNEIFVDWTADPVVLKDKLRGIFTGRQLLIGPASFLCDDNNWTSVRGGAGAPGYIELANDKPARCPVNNIPIGATITLVELLVDPTGSFFTDTTFKMFRYGFDSGATATELFAVTTVTLTKHIISSGVQVIVTDANSMLEIDVSWRQASGTAQLRVYGARVTYDLPAIFP